MGGIRRDGNELRRTDLQSFLIYLDPPPAFHTINDDMLTDAPGPLHIVEFRLGIVSYIRYIGLSRHRVPGQKFRHDLLGKNDDLLPLKPLSLS